MVAIFPEFLHVTSLVNITGITPITVQSLTGEGLRVTWEINKSNSSEPDNGTLTIYNLQTAARKSLRRLFRVCLRSGFDVL